MNSELEKSKYRVKNRKQKKDSSKPEIGKLFKQLDLFGQKVTLTYKGEEYFKTYLGAIVSLLVFATILAYTLFRGYIWIQKINPSVSKKSLIRDVGTLTYKPQELGFDFSLGVGRDLDPTLFKLSIS